MSVLGGAWMRRGLFSRDVVIKVFERCVWGDERAPSPAADSPVHCNAHKRPALVVFSWFLAFLRLLMGNYSPSGLFLP